MSNSEDIEYIRLIAGGAYELYHTWNERSVSLVKRQVDAIYLINKAYFHVQMDDDYYECIPMSQVKSFKFKTKDNE